MYFDKTRFWRVKFLWPFYLLICVGLLGGVYFFQSEGDGQNLSDAISAFVQLLAASIAVLLYKLQKMHDISFASSVVYNEICYAEVTLEGIRKDLDRSLWPESIDTRVLQGDYWENLDVHLRRYLDQEDIAAIDGFYKKCRIIQRGIEGLDIASQIDSKMNSIQGKIVEYADDLSPEIISPTDPSKNPEEDFSKKFLHFLGWLS